MALPTLIGQFVISAGTDHNHAHTDRFETECCATHRVSDTFRHRSPTVMQIGTISTCHPTVKKELVTSELNVVEFVWHQ